MKHFSLIAALLALSLTACGEKPATQPVETPPAAEAPAPAAESPAPAAEAPAPAAESPAPAADAASAPAPAAK